MNTDKKEGPTNQQETTEVTEKAENRHSPLFSPFAPVQILRFLSVFHPRLIHGSDFFAFAKCVIRAFSKPQRAQRTQRSTVPLRPLRPLWFLPFCRRTNQRFEQESRCAGRN